MSTDQAAEGGHDQEAASQLCGDTEFFKKFHWILFRGISWRQQGMQAHHGPESERRLALPQCSHARLPGLRPFHRA
ncbi:hypothetical protein HNP55_002152 [Paucibacter oligotrophus]|uniref:Uncharacterized protein n=1 Tax=Roseateles oligotrophus TaxID=1769250 RepID=A0A840LC14_9BURK|nr:hypothetical protein [Roseateles oligotrophus]